MVGIVPGVQSILTARQELAKRIVVSSGLAQKVKMLEGLDAGELQTKLDTSVLSFPILLPYQSSLSMLSTVLSRHNITLTDIKFTATKTQTGSALGIDLSINGPYSSLNLFLVDLEKSAPLVAVKSIEARKTSKPNVLLADTRYSATVNIAIGYEKPPSTIGKASEPLPNISQDLEKAVATLRTFEAFKPELLSDSGSIQPADSLFPE